MRLDEVHVMSNDVMFKVLSSSPSPLSKVKSFELVKCPAAPFVHLPNMEQIVLEDLHFVYCDMDDEGVLHAAVENHL